MRGPFANSTQVTGITVNANGFNNYVDIANSVTQAATINGGPGNNYLVAGGGDTTLVSGTGTNRLVGGAGDDTFDAQQGRNTIEDGNGASTVNLAPRPTQVNTGILGNLTPPANSPVINRTGRNSVLGFKDRQTVNGLNPTLDRDLRAATTPPNLSSTLGIPPSLNTTLPQGQVGTLLARAAAATSFNNAIVAVVDRNGQILGVRVEGGVSPAITQNLEKLIFAIDGAVAEARTGAFFANDTAPLTSRTVQFISQSTITQREVESNPSIQDQSSPLAGPGFVAPIEIGGNFPPGINNTSLVDLFNIEETNRDSTEKAIYDANGNVINRMALAQRFNINPNFIPATQTLLPNPLEPPTATPDQILATPNSYGVASGLELTAQGRGIGTLPGGIPIFENDQRTANTPVLLGGIGVFFPGTTGFADEENSALSSNFDPNKIDLSEVAEYTAFAAVGGSSGFNASIGTLNGIPAISGFNLPAGQINLQRHPVAAVRARARTAREQLVQFGKSLGIGNPNSTAATTVTPGASTGNAEHAGEPRPAPRS